MGRPERGAAPLIALLVALPLALGACGGSDNGDSTSPAPGLAGTSGASGATGATGATRAGGTTGRAGTSGKTAAPQKQSSGGSSAPPAGTGGTPPAGNDQGGSSSPAANEKPKKSKQKAQSKVTQPSLAGGRKDLLYKQAKAACHYLTLEGLAREYNVPVTTPEAVARRYAQAYPDRVRNAVYRGCKAGLGG